MLLMKRDMTAGIRLREILAPMPILIALLVALVVGEYPLALRAALKNKTGVLIKTFAGIS